MAHALWHNFGQLWDRKDLDFALAYFRAEGLNSKTLLHAARFIGRQPDSILIKMVKEKMAKQSTLSEQYTIDDAEGNIHQSSVHRLSRMSAQAVYDATPEYDPDALRKYVPGVVEKHAEALKRMRPDDRIVYLSHNEEGHIVQASLSWDEIAEIGLDEKRVVDITELAQTVLNTMNPLERLAVRTAVKEGKA